MSIDSDYMQRKMLKEIEQVNKQESAFNSLEAISERIANIESMILDMKIDLSRMSGTKFR